jgi:hypothetical protein
MSQDRAADYLHLRQAFLWKEQAFKDTLAEVDRAAHKVAAWKTHRPVSPRGNTPPLPGLDESEWPTRDRINLALKEYQDAAEAARDAYDDLAPHERAQVGPLPF